MIVKKYASLLSIQSNYFNPESKSLERLPSVIYDSFVATLNAAGLDFNAGEVKNINLSAGRKNKTYRIHLTDDKFNKANNDKEVLEILKQAIEDKPQAIDYVQTEITSTAINVTDNDIEDDLVAVNLQTETNFFVKVDSLNVAHTEEYRQALATWKYLHLQLSIDNNVINFLESEKRRRAFGKPLLFKDSCVEPWVASQDKRKPLILKNISPLQFAENKNKEIECSFSIPVNITNVMTSLFAKDEAQTSESSTQFLIEDDNSCSSSTIGTALDTLASYYKNKENNKVSDNAQGKNNFAVTLFSPQKITVDLGTSNSSSKSHSSVKP